MNQQNDTNMQLYISVIKRRRVLSVVSSVEPSSSSSSSSLLLLLILLIGIITNTTRFVSSFQSTGTSTTVFDVTTSSRTSQRRVHCAQQSYGYSRPFLCTSTIMKVSTSTDETTSTSSTKASTTNDPSIYNENSKKKINHYEILGATMTDTREEIKRKYIELVKLYHPDALIGTSHNNSDNTNSDNSNSNNNNNNNNNNNKIQFTQLTSAWKVLSNERERKLYDRTLRIEKIGTDITKWAGTTLFSKEQSNDIATTSLTVLEQILVPFIRRTTATTLATVQAAVGSTSTSTSSSSSSSSSSNNKDTDSVPTKKRKFSLSAVAAAAIKANEYIDTLERQEQITLYTDKAFKLKQQSSTLQIQLQNLIQQSLPLTIQLLNSNITSIEATMIIDRILLEKEQLQQQQQQNQDDDDDDQQKRQQQNQDDVIIDNIRRAINELQNLEEVYEQYNTVENTIQEEYKYYIQQEQINEQLLKDAIDEEEAARIAYIASKEKTYKQQQILQKNIQNLIITKDLLMDNTNKINHHTTILQQQSEQVRIQLLHQTTVTSNNNNNSDNNISDIEELTYLRQRENELVNEINQLEYEAATLLAKANAKS